MLAKCISSVVNELLEMRKRERKRDDYPFGLKKKLIGTN